MPMTPEEHGVHMEAMMNGLKQIAASQDLNEIHSIAQGLLGEEESEKEKETESEPTRKEAFINSLKNVASKNEVGGLSEAMK